MPDVWNSVRPLKHPTKAGDRGIGFNQSGGVGQHDFEHVCWSLVQGVEDTTPVVRLIVDVRVLWDADVAYKRRI